LNRKNEGTSKPALAARVAIDSGPVVVDAAAEIFGDTPNIAARAQARGNDTSKCDMRVAVRVVAFLAHSLPVLKPGALCKCRRVRFL
jgi:class 3 adenylate cyclase